MNNFERECGRQLERNSSSARANSAPDFIRRRAEEHDKRRTQSLPPDFRYEKRGKGVQTDEQESSIQTDKDQVFENVTQFIQDQLESQKHLEFRTQQNKGNQTDEQNIDKAIQATPEHRFQEVYEQLKTQKGDKQPQVDIGVQTDPKPEKRKTIVQMHKEISGLHKEISGLTERQIAAFREKAESSPGYERHLDAFLELATEGRTSRDKIIENLENIHKNMDSMRLNPRDAIKEIRQLTKDTKHDLSDYMIFTNSAASQEDLAHKNESWYETTDETPDPLSYERLAGMSDALRSLSKASGSRSLIEGYYKVLNEWEALSQSEKERLTPPEPPQPEAKPPQRRKKAML